MPKGIYTRKNAHYQKLCEDCGARISWKATRCPSCATKGSRNPMWEGGFDKVAYQASYYEQNREIILPREKEKTNVRRAAIRLFVDSFKQVPCMDCGIQYPTYVTHFDHRPGETKLFNIGSALGKLKTKEAIQLEIAKCDLVCANCHAERTQRRRIV